MSIILDSLKRAERERRVGDTPAVDTLYEEKPASARSPKPKRRWLAGLLLVNLAVVGLLAIALYQRQPVPEVPVPQAQPTPPKTVESRDVVQPPPPPTDKELSASAAVKKQPPTPPAPEARKAPMPPDPPAPPKEVASPGDVRFGPPVAVAEDDLKAETSIDPPPVPFNPATQTAVQTTNADADQPFAPETLARTTPPAGPEPALETEVLTPPDEAQLPMPANADEEPQWVSVPQQRPAETIPAPPVKQDRVMVAPSPPQSFATTTAPAPSSPGKRRPTAPDPANQAPLLKDLPPDVREKLKTVKISVLVYAEPQEACMVYINSRRYHTGDRIGTEGYLLERITPDGIILDYGKGRVKIRSGY
jgi:general secretion pathway protein B